MTELIARAYAKVNVGLEVLAKRDDGYHELRSILQTVDFYDELEFRRRDDGIELTTSDGELPSGPENLVHRAATALAEYARTVGRATPGVSIRLEKRVPAGMGLGGGSADAATTLVALDRLWQLHAPAPDLHRLAGEIGMDVPFFLYGGTALAIGRGDEVYPLPMELDWPIVLILPDFFTSTASVYTRLILTKRRPGLTLQHFAWKRPAVRDGLGELVNHLEGATGSNAPAIREYKTRLLEQGALGAMMSGSGSGVFGVFESSQSARDAADALARERIRAVATNMLTRQAYEQRRFSGDPRPNG